MISITVGNIPDQFPSQLRKQAEMEPRSMNREIIRLLDLSAHQAHAPECRLMPAQAQVEAWSRLGGRWISDVPVEDEIAEIYAARSGGREVEL